MATGSADDIFKRIFFEENEITLIQILNAI